LFPGEYWQIAHLELDSPLTRVMAETKATPGYRMQQRGTEVEAASVAIRSTQAASCEPERGTFGLDGDAEVAASDAVRRPGRWTISWGRHRRARRAIR
jgi:hypothetical protein